jgi:hypothetical protein
VWKRRDLIAGVLVVLASRLATLPRSLWEFDEPLFLEAVLRYDPANHHPPPPGYPVFVALSKLLNLLVRDSFTSLVVLSLIGTVIGFVALALALGRLAGNDRIGLAGSLLFYFSPVMLVHSVLPISDPAALGLLFLTLLAATQLLGYGAQPAKHLDAVVFAMLAALTIGCRPQFSIAILPMLLWILIATPWRPRLLALAVFGATCLLWLAPLVLALGGLDPWWTWLTLQANYFAAHDAAISRGGRSWTQIVLRFVAHPWGPKWLSFPLLLAAMLGLPGAIRFRLRGTVAVAALCLPYLIFAVLLMDPADGPRYALPALPLVAFLAATALHRLGAGWRVFSVVALFALGSCAYVAPFISQRVRSASPPVQAAQFARPTIPPSSVILYELPLWPHAKHLFKEYATLRIDEGLRQYSHRPDVPLFLYADGEPGGQPAHTFRWDWSDAYGKLTRNHYRVVSFIPVPPQERYRRERGVYDSERTVSGEHWRWLDQQAELELPELGSTRVAITLGLPRASPLQSNKVRISINGRPVQEVTLQRAQSAEVLLDLPPGLTRIQFDADKTFVPAELPGALARDPRRLSVQLLRVRQL